MQYEEILSIIQSKRRFGQAYGRDVTAEMMRHLGYPEKGMKVIHIAGTNGKGSTAAFVSSILQAADFVVGQFTSPHLVCFRERIMVNGEMIPEEDVVRLGERLLSLPMDLECTMFDLCLGMAILYFKEQDCDYVVLETGLGGAKDSTTGLSVTPLVCGFTNIGFDHTAILGNTLSEIASEKAGILKSGTVAVIGKMENEARKTIETEAERLGVETYNVDNLLTKISTRKMALNGVFQRENATLAVGIVEALFNQKSGYLLDKKLSEIVDIGLATARWPGRMEQLQENPIIILDGAHNPQGVEALFNSLVEAYPGEKFVFLVGVMADKEYDNMMRQMFPIADCFYTVTVESERSLQAETLAEQLRGKGQMAQACVDLLTGVEQAKSYAVASGKKLVIFGSLYFVGEVKHIYEACDFLREGVN